MPAQVTGRAFARGGGPARWLPLRRTTSEGGGSVRSQDR
jgi:hypothetical protein